MQTEYKEIYANDKPELTKLVQEWLDENILKLYCKFDFFSQNMNKTDK